jgi:hypothetical protein
MNQQQRKYAMTRIDGVYKARVNQARLEYKPASLTYSDMKAQIASGEAPMKDLSELPQGNPTMSYMFDFLRPSQEAVAEANKVLMEKLGGLLTEKNAVCDAIMLGDSEEALSAIQNYEG